VFLDVGLSLTKQRITPFVPGAFDDEEPRLRRIPGASVNRPSRGAGMSRGQARGARRRAACAGRQGWLAARRWSGLRVKVRDVQESCHATQ
jgi:hypothetical protein